MGRAPTIGGAVALPAWMGVGPVRVLDVRPDRIPGWVQIDGYEIGRPETETTYRAALAQLRTVPDATYSAP
ncbi:hypothetical protein [Actinocatenispora comari]|jgi:hypothetical protein|uniref:Uncharacterized protein n=1 Tax=Actinocatenispora comari TaxID=2807577 RepID=A0A8J4ELD2_9ACTN|nr:hypothetical protein [Actinocatenispora comari]GIL29152.1 hypothetical protein NUM_44060 [Actinocatenispora comari]